MNEHLDREQQYFRLAEHDRYPSLTILLESPQIFRNQIFRPHTSPVFILLHAFRSILGATGLHLLDMA